MITETKVANAVGAKTARACDSCLCKRAHWYCASDDAFLCKGCDGSVHSANQLASRHERVRLGTASFKATANKANSPPAWHHGFTRKPRTQRQRKDKESIAATYTSPMVPEIGSEEASNDDSEEQLLYRVPVFDPFDAELCEAFHQNIGHGVRQVNGTNGHDGQCDFDNLNGFLQSDMELAEFAADVESLLGTGMDDDSCGIEELGLTDGKEVDTVDCFGGNRMKVEDEEAEAEAIIACSVDPTIDMTREMIDWNFDYEEEEEEKAVVVPEAKMMKGENKEEVHTKILLRLNYEEVMTAWDNQRCPWTTGCRPEFNPDECWPDFMGIYGGGVHQPYGGVGGRVDGGREARVSRYREKRRTRLFSKKIRYEVRKLNAEKRPRMKGRFVKRTSFVGGGPSFPQYVLNK